MEDSHCVDNLHQKTQLSGLQASNVDPFQCSEESWHVIICLITKWQYPYPAHIGLVPAEQIERWLSTISLSPLVRYLLWEVANVIT
jgi:hypothetical protein